MRFYANTDALYELEKLDLGNERAELDFTVDLIEQAMQFEYLENEDRQFKMFGRSVLGANQYSPVKITSNDQVEGPIIEADFEYDAEMEGFLTSSYDAVVRLSKYIKKEHIDDMFYDLDPETEGILIYADNGTVEYKVVKEKERPFLLCFAPNGAVDMARPYKDELTDEDIERITKPQTFTGCSGNCAGCASSGGCSGEAAGDCGCDCGCDDHSVDMGDDFSGFEEPESEYVYHSHKDRENKVNKVVSEEEAGASAGAAAAEAVAREQAEMAEQAEAEENAGSDFTFDDILKLAEQGFPEMMMYAANCYFVGIDGENPDQEKAVYWMERAANEGLPMAMYNMGMYNFFGFGMDINLEKAQEWMEKGAEMGDEASMSLVEMCKDFITMRTNARKGNPKDQLDYADAIMMVNKDMREFNTKAGYQEALKWYKEASTKIEDDELTEKISLLEQMIAQIG